MKLYQQGDETFGARCNLLKEVRADILETKRKYEIALEKLDYKIRRYEEAVQTGRLVWDEEKQ